VSTLLTFPVTGKTTLLIVLDGVKVGVAMHKALLSINSKFESKKPRPGKKPRRGFKLI